jgi:hypothetical protein
MILCEMGSLPSKPGGSIAGGMPEAKPPKLTIAEAD